MHRFCGDTDSQPAVAICHEVVDRSKALLHPGGISLENNVLEMLLDCLSKVSSWCQYRGIAKERKKRNSGFLIRSQTHDSLLAEVEKIALDNYSCFVQLLQVDVWVKPIFHHGVMEHTCLMRLHLKGQKFSHFAVTIDM